MGGGREAERRPSQGRETYPLASAEIGGRKRKMTKSILSHNRGLHPHEIILLSGKKKTGGKQGRDASSMAPFASAKKVIHQS